MDRGRSEVTTEEIVEVAQGMFKTKGFDKTSLQDLLERLDIHESAFKEFFQSKDNLLEVVWSESLRTHKKEERRLLQQQVSCCSQKDMTGPPCATS